MYTFAMHMLLKPLNIPRLKLALTAPILALTLSLPVSAQDDAGGDNARALQAISDAERSFSTETTAAAALAVETRARPRRYGWIEKVIVSPEFRWELDAKLDTGADTSSLDAKKIRRVRFKGKSYVRFSVEDPESGELVSLRRPYVRTVRIRRHNGNHQRRYVALMTVCLGQDQRTIEVTLTDREVFDYPMLLGRSALEGLAIVDPQATYTTEPACGIAGPPDADEVVSGESEETVPGDTNSKRDDDVVP